MLVLFMAGGEKKKAEECFFENKNNYWTNLSFGREVLSNE
jgi:hypothetical protein